MMAEQKSDAVTRCLAVGSALTIAATIAACGSDSVGPASTSDATDPVTAAASAGTQADEFPFPHWEREHYTSESLAALHQGTLIREHGCLYVHDQDTSGQALIIFPDDATWNEATQTVELDGNVAAIGEDVSIGGGEIAKELVSGVPSECDSTYVIAAAVLGPPLPSATQ